MTVSSAVWVVSLLVLGAILVADLAIVGRRPHKPTVRESVSWVTLYIALAACFGLGLWLFAGARPAAEFFTGWLTEYSLSVDNLFVFIVIMSRFAVPQRYQQKILLIGIVLALVMRGVFIAAGAALVREFSGVFYVFGIFLIYTAIRLVLHKDDSTDFKENVAIKLARRIIPMTDQYADGKMRATINGVRMFTPIIIVMIAIGTTDLIFALDSIPAIFGITAEPYLVFAANVFALMGLRQLYFLLGGLLDRLVYLSHGLSIVLGFIGVKLTLQALAENRLPFINGGEKVAWAPHVPIWFSLSFIALTLIITTVASLTKSARDRARLR